MLFEEKFIPTFQVMARVGILVSNIKIVVVPNLLGRLVSHAT
jgi:hypothetical protein